MKKSFKIVGLVAAMMFSGQMYAQNVDIYKGVEFNMP